MQLLFAISVFSFLVVVWAAIAFARHIKAGPAPELSIVPAKRDFKHHLLAAHESVAQEPATQAPIVREATIPEETLNLAPEPLQPRKPIPEPPASFTPELSVSRTRHNDLNQSARDIAANKQWILPPHAMRTQRPGVTLQSAARKTAPNTVLRKPPQPVRQGTMELLDPAYFNKDMGDLSDPYQPPRLSANDRNKPA